MLFCFVYWAGNRTFCFASWTGTRMFAFGSWQGTPGSQRLELTVANVGTTGYHCKEMAVARGWNAWFPTWEPEVTIASNCRFPPGNHRLQGIAGSQKLEFMFLKLSGFHCKELLVPKAWNSWLQAWKSNVTSGRICWLQKVRTHGS